MGDRDHVGGGRRRVGDREDRSLDLVDGHAGGTGDGVEHGHGRHFGVAAHGETLAVRLVQALVLDEEGDESKAGRVEPDTGHRIGFVAHRPDGVVGERLGRGCTVRTDGQCLGEPNDDHRATVRILGLGKHNPLGAVECARDDLIGVVDQLRQIRVGVVVVVTYLGALQVADVRHAVVAIQDLADVPTFAAGGCWFTLPAAGDEQGTADGNHATQGVAIHTHTSWSIAGARRFHWAHRPHTITL